MKYLALFGVLALLAGGAFADELLVNGTFEQPMDVGWTDTVVGSYGAARFEWSDTLGSPTANYAVKVYKTLANYASLSQSVAVTDVDAVLSLDARLRIGGGSSTCWPVAAIIVGYYNAAGTSLGNTRIYLHDQYCTWARSDTMSLIEVTTPDVWHRYDLDIAQELATNLPGINPAEVARLQVNLYSFDNGT
jgi:hypothetical protein